MSKHRTKNPRLTDSNQQALKPGQLDALVAPIALYPDTLLANVLMASTYPLEVVQAQRWVGERKGLEGDALKKEAEKQGWDDSVKSLVATPSVLTLMNSKLDWTQKLGDAVLAQQPDVMDAVQRLRTKAYANNKLQTTKEQKVAIKQENNRELIAIEPANADTINVPYYDPAVVYGEWPYPEYPPYYWYPEPGYVASGVIATGLAFGGAYASRSLGYGRALVGRQHQLGQARHQHQPRCPRGTLAARCPAPPWSGLQQCERATEVCRHHRSPRRQSKAGFSRPRRPAGVEARRR